MKFRVKIAVCMVCLLSLIFGIGGSMLISMSFGDSLGREKEAAINSYQMVLNTLLVVNNVSPQADYSYISRTLEQLSSQNSSVWSALRLTADENSNSVYESGDAVEYLNGNIAQADANSCTISFFEGEKGAKYLQLSGELTANEETLRLDIAYDISPIYKTRHLQQSAYHKIFLIMVCICAILSFLMAWFLTKPLMSLSRASRELASGNLSYRSRISSKDEVGTLSSDFNSMANKLEKSITELKDAMERQERFMGSFAHELKTPMTSVIGYADLLRSQALDPTEQMDAANYIFSEGRRLESLSLKLLDIIVMNKKEISLVYASPARIITDLAERLKPMLAERDIQLEYKCEEGLCRLEPDLVKSLLINLIDNARKAIDKAGGIFIVSEMLRDGCRIRVLDNGRGMPPGALEHITEAFFRVDKSRSRAQGGVGLGLTLCSEIVKLHNGTIEFESHEPRGTCVTVELKGGRV